MFSFSATSLRLPVFLNQTAPQCHRSCSTVAPSGFSHAARSRGRSLSAFRRGSEAAWKAQDPQLPKSIWYHTDAKWLGFRIIRPLEIPSAEEMFAAWNNGVSKEQ